MTLKMKPFGIVVGKGENAGNQFTILSVGKGLSVFYPFQKQM